VWFGSKKYLPLHSPTGLSTASVPLKKSAIDAASSAGGAARTAGAASIRPAQIRAVMGWAHWVMVVLPFLAA
jgi:hypothetical protein